MEVYGGKNSQKKREETRERVLREKASFIKNLLLIFSIVPLIASAAYLTYRYFSVTSWNETFLAKTKEAWSAMDTLEEDVMNASLFLKGCKKSMIFKQMDGGFQINSVNARNMSMEVLQNQPEYNENALMVYLGSGIKTGDTLTLCNQEEEKNLKLKVIRSNPKYGYHYLMFDQETQLPTVPTNLIKFSPVVYTWERLADGTERLLRKGDGKEVEILSGIQSHKVDYSFDEEDGYFAVDIVLSEKLPNGDAIHFKRNIPLQSFQRLPKELEDKIP